MSDQEAKLRADFDIQWKVALGITVDEKPFANSTGYLKGRRMKVAVDTPIMLGGGAVKDTYNQLITGADVIPGNASDNTGVLDLVKQSEEKTGMEVKETIGNAVYGDGSSPTSYCTLQTGIIY
ncbi:hypothetical protein ACFLTZ_05515 [Chloroflexota bacterium]